MYMTYIHAHIHIQEYSHFMQCFLWQILLPISRSSFDENILIRIYNYNFQVIFNGKWYLTPFDKALYVFLKIHIYEDDKNIFILNFNLHNFRITY